MKRQTQIVDMERQFGDVGVRGGLHVFNMSPPQRAEWSERCPGAAACWHADVRGEARAPCPPIETVWAPHILSISMAAKQGDGLAAEPITDGEFQASLIPYDLYTTIKADPGGKIGQAALYKETAQRQDLIGFRSADTARRIVYGSNSGAGYPVPRQVNPGEGCADPGYYWVLVLYWQYAVPGPAPRRAAWVLDYEYRSREA